MVKFSKILFTFTLLILVGATIISFNVGRKMESYIPVILDSQEREASLVKSVNATEVELTKEHFKLLFDNRQKALKAELKLLQLNVLWFKRLVLVFLFCISALIFLGYVHAKRFKEAP